MLPVSLSGFVANPSSTRSCAQLSHHIFRFFAVVLKQQLQIEPAKLSEYAAKWRFKHILVKLEKQVGIKDGPHFNLVSGILFAPLSLTPTVPLLQRVIQADATHIVLGNILYYFPG